MKIRKIKKADLDRCAEILIGSYAQKPYSEKLKRTNAKKYLEQKFNCCKDSSYVAIIENIIVGFIFWQISFWSDGKQSILEEIVIDKNCQGKGIGTELVKFSEKFFKKEGLKSSMLWAKNDKRVVGFHRKNGFRSADDYIVMFKDY